MRRGALPRLVPSEDLWRPGRDVGADEQQVLGRSNILELGSHILEEGRGQLSIQPRVTLGCLQDFIGDPVGKTELLVLLNSLRQG